MKLFVKLMMFLVVLALAGPFIMRGPDGRPLMTLKDLKLPDFSLPSSAPETLSGQEQQAWISWSKDENAPKQAKVYVIDPTNQEPIAARAGVFYRWKDSSGSWQFSNVPNPDTPNIVVETDPNANILQSLSTDKIDAALGRAKAMDPGLADKADAMADDMPTIPLPTTIPITEVPELINQAKAVQDLMNQRTEMLNRNQF
jgi:hypothetical protein